MCGDHPVEWEPDRRWRSPVPAQQPPRGMMIRAMAMCHLLYVNRCAAAWKEEDCVGSIPHIASRDAYFACEQTAKDLIKTTVTADKNLTR